MIYFRINVVQFIKVGCLLCLLSMGIPSLGAVWEPIQWSYCAATIPKDSLKPVSIEFSPSRKNQSEMSPILFKFPSLSISNSTLLTKPKPTSNLTSFFLMGNYTPEFFLTKDESGDLYHKIVLRSGHTFSTSFLTRTRKTYGSLNYYLTKDINISASPDTRSISPMQKSWEMHFLLNLPIY